MIPGRPMAEEYLDYFDTYISLVPDEDILLAMRQQVDVIREVATTIPADQLDVLHAPYTWTIKQVFGHCIDTERVFSYRAARFAAGDQTALPGFDQDAYVAKTDYNASEFSDLVDELVAVRESTIYLLNRQNHETWLRGGLADGKKMTVRAAAYSMVGHIRYHLKIVRDRLASS